MAVLLLSFVGGYVDALGYIKLDGLFTSSITGNLVAACTAIDHNQGVLARAFVSIAFALAAALSVVAILRLKIVREWKKRSIGILLFSLEIVFFIIVIPLGLHYNDEISSDGAIFRWPLILVGSLLGASMGVHNAAAKEYIPNCPATTVMTMTLVSVSISWAQMVTYSAAHYLGLTLLPKGKPIPQDYENQMMTKAEASIASFSKVIKPLIFFLIGAFIGAVITKYGSFWALFVPIGLIVWLVADIILSRVFRPRTPLLNNAQSHVEMVPPSSTTKVEIKEDFTQTAPTPELENTLYENVELDVDEGEHAIDIVDKDQEIPDDDDDDDEEEAKAKSPTVVNQYTLV
eukprot:gene8391-9250_t